MTLFRNKENKGLYIIYDMIHNIKALDAGGSVGLWAFPFIDKFLPKIKHTVNECDRLSISFDRNQFLEENFEKISYV